MLPLFIDPSAQRYRALIGIGGIGAGSFFALDGNHTLGREESRTGRFLPNRDYAKLHIVSHYVQTLMGPDFTTLPIGRVGDDEAGHRLCSEMRSVGMNLRHVRALEDAQTMNCICLLYPDGSGGNLTIGDSACNRVDVAAVREAEPDFEAFQSQGIALAVPEVPLEAREEVLALGTRYGCFRVASFSSGEMRNPAIASLLGIVDLLVLNSGESAAFAELPEDTPPYCVAEVASNRVASINPRMHVVVTAGANGSWAWDGEQLMHVPAFDVTAVSAAGAGDAFLAGVLVGLAAGVDFDAAQQLGSLAGALSATSPHTINFNIDRTSLASFAKESRLAISPGLGRILFED